MSRRLPVVKVKFRNQLKYFSLSHDRPEEGAMSRPHINYAYAAEYVTLLTDRSVKRVCRKRHDSLVSHCTDDYSPCFVINGSLISRFPCLKSLA